MEEFKPGLTQLLEALRLDVAYVRGQGDHLYYLDGRGREVEVLDLVGGYGSLLLGHNHPEIVAAARRFLDGGTPVHAQGSRRRLAERLAAELSTRAGGGYCAVFANSGAEAVEAALKHALLETGARTFIALEGAFHGKTLGAVQLASNLEYREPFALPGLEVERIPPDSLHGLEAAFERLARPAGLILEPVQGEGGIRPLDRAFARRARELCARRRIPLIADECQTGLGRTGRFLASEPLGLDPDYIILSKALGGGLAKVSALLIRRERYRPDFDLRHSSTFADDEFSSAMALRTLELIDERLLAACREKGERLLAGLRELAGRHPGAVAEVRGAGLMLGIEFRPLSRSPSFILRFLSWREDLALILTGYLLNVHRIRVAPTLSDRLTLRLQPSAFIGDGEVARLLDALEDACARIEAGDAPGLTSYLLGGHGPADEVSAVRRPERRPFAFHETRLRERSRSAPPVRVAWLCHLIDADDLVRLEPSFGGLLPGEREEYLRRFLPFSEPVVMSAADVRSPRGGRVRFYPILLPFTSAWVKRRIEGRRLALPRRLVQRGLDLARALGASVVALGQYTSIATLNGRRLSRGGLGVTTGNCYAVALAAEALRRAHRERGMTPEESVLAVAGAAGNIGRACAEVLTPRYRRTILVGSDRPGSRERLEELAGKLPRAVAAGGLAAIRDADTVVAALNAVDAPLGPEHLSAGAVVCDLSVPAAVTAGIAALRPDLLLVEGGVARLPCGEDLEIEGFPLPAGQVYACMAEAIILGLEGVRDASFTGPLSAVHVRRIAEMAARHGFALAESAARGPAAAAPRETCLAAS